MERVKNIVQSKVTLKCLCFFAFLNAVISGALLVLPFILSKQQDISLYQPIRQQNLPYNNNLDYTIRSNSCQLNEKICQKNTITNQFMCTLLSRDCPQARQIEGLNSDKKYDNVEGFQLYGLIDLVKDSDGYKRKNYIQRLNATVIQEFPNGWKIISFYYFYNQKTVDLYDNLMNPSNIFYQISITGSFYTTIAIYALWGFTCFFTCCICCKAKDLYMELKWMFNMERAYLLIMIQSIRKDHKIRVFWMLLIFIIILLIPYWQVAINIIHIIAQQSGGKAEVQKSYAEYKEQFLIDLQYWNPCESPEKCKSLLKYLDDQQEEDTIQMQIVNVCKYIYYIMAGFLSILSQYPIYFPCCTKYIKFYKKVQGQYIPIYVNYNRRNQIRNFQPV